MCTIYGCPIFIPGIVILILWLAAWAIVFLLAIWAVAGWRITPALLAVAMAGLLYAVSS